ncbi:insect pheromone-binding family, a10/OS-D domain-containing protein [Phthorimaea operculella]|nr:insect pheromone-binding family, a10/OS-D domain-containing protein [Phthorimaea operculella]
MRIFLLCCYLLVLAVAQEYYDRRYDYFDVDSLIQNRRLLRKYLQCFLDRGPCPPIGRVFKNLLPEVVRTSCAKCSPRQKVFTRKVVNAFYAYHPSEFAELKKKLDPENKYFDNFEKALPVL